jgi:hypothetical protein
MCQIGRGEMEGLIVMVTFRGLDIWIGSGNPLSFLDVFNRWEISKRVFTKSEETQDDKKGENIFNTSCQCQGSLKSFLTAILEL